MAAAQAKIEDSNIALLGSDLEKEVKRAAASHEPQWVGAGAKEGIQIWRIEQFIVTPWPEKQYGQFHSGDSYIVLHTYRKRGKEDDALAWDIFFWLGDETTADEAGTAAYKTVELDDVLGGAPVQHREVQGFESEPFMSLFDHKVVYLEGGVESGFTHVEATKHRSRLLQVKGKRGNMMVREVELHVRSMNSGDVFILDAGSRLWQWQGSGANPAERQKAGDLARAMRDERVSVGGPGAKPPLDVVDQGSEDRDFWEALMGVEAVKEMEAAALRRAVAGKPPKAPDAADLGLSDGTDGSLTGSEADHYMAACTAAEAAGKEAPPKPRKSRSRKQRKARKAAKKLSPSDLDKAAADEFAGVDYSQAADGSPAPAAKLGAPPPAGSLVPAASTKVGAAPADADKAAADEHLGVDYTQATDGSASAAAAAAGAGAGATTSAPPQVSFGHLIKDAKAGGEDEEVKTTKKLFRLTDGVPVDVEQRIREREAARRNFKAEEDAQVLRQALKKFIGKDTAAITDIFAKRTRSQLNLVKDEYKKQFDRDLYKDLKKKTSLFDADLKKVYKALLLTPVEFEAHTVHQATKGTAFGTDDSTLVEVLCTKTNKEVAALKQAYWLMYVKELVAQVKQDTGGPFDKHYGALLQKLLRGERSADKPDPDMALVDSDATVLYKAGEGKFFGTDEQKFADILATRSFTHLRLVFQAYQKKSKKGRTFEEAVRKSTSGKFRKALLMICLAAQQDQKRMDRYYAERLYRSMKGLGTRDSVLVRELMTVIDNGRLENVKAAFYVAYQATLSSWITGDTSGDYRKVLLAMVGEDSPEMYGGKPMQFIPVAEGVVKRSMLDSNDAFIFDTGFDVFIWLGKDASSREKREGLHFAQSYLREHQLSQHTPITRILEGGENETFNASLDKE